MTTVVYLGAFEPYDWQTLPEFLDEDETVPNPFRIPGPWHFKNEGGSTFIPEIRDFVGNSSLILAVNDDDVIVGVGDGTLVPPPIGGRRLFELPELTFNRESNDYRDYLGKVFNSTTGVISNPPEPVPLQISAAQAKIWLRRQEKRVLAENMVAQAGGEIEDWYNFANTWDYENTYVIAFCDALSINREQAFREAAQIV